MTPAEMLRRQRPHYHDSRQLIADDLDYLVHEMHDKCKTHNVPFITVMEQRFQPPGSHYSSTGYFPQERAEVCGWPARMLLAFFASTAEEHLIEKAVATLNKANILTAVTTKEAP